MYFIKLAISLFVIFNFTFIYTGIDSVEAAPPGCSNPCGCPPDPCCVATCDPAPPDSSCVFDSNCGGGQTCCQGQCVGAGECGGGGGFQGQSCGGGTTLTCGSPTLYTQSGGSVTNDSNLGQCVQRGTCDTYFPSRHIVTGCDGSEIKGRCQDNCGCCAPGSTYTPTQTQGSTYTRDIGCNTPTQFACSDWDDIFILRTPRGGSSNCYCDCPDEERGCGANCNQRGGSWIKNDLITCRTVTTTWACQSNCTITAPSNLAVVAGSTYASATAMWSAGSGGTQYISVGTDQAKVTAGCVNAGDCIVDIQLGSTTNSYPISGMSPSTTYYVRIVRYQSDSCSGEVGATHTTAAANQIAGTVYLDPNNVCSPSTPWTGGGMSVALSTGQTGTVGANGTYTINVGAQTTIPTATLTGFPTGYACSTASGCNQCPTKTNVSTTGSTNFFITLNREAWWQAVGGNIYASGNVRSELPSASTYLIDSGLGGAIGALTRSSGSVDVGTGAVSTEGYSAQTRYRGKTMNYDYFAAHMGVTPNTQNYWGTNVITKPTTAADWYYLAPTGGNSAMITGLDVLAGESYVIFVNGDLRIAGNVTVEDGGFLAILVNGSVNVSPAVEDIHGLYVVDSALTTESNGTSDAPANFEGSMVAWGGVNLGRDLVSDNVSTAAEKFTYRVDLLNNMPDSMKVFALKWEEVVPGTIGN